MTEKAVSEHAAWSGALIRVGDGRGFVIETRREWFVLTAGHCLPKMPPCLSFAFEEERTYPALLGPLDNDPTVWAECVFFDPIADLAVLAAPDGQDFYEESIAYDALVDAAIPLAIGKVPLTRRRIEMPGGYEPILGPLEWQGEAWLPSLDRRWYRCDIRAGSRGLIIPSAAERIEGGMSGSPIVSHDGEALGVIVSNTGPQPFLSRQLPAWLLDEVKEST